MERFERFRFSVPAVPLQKGFSVLQYTFTGKDGSGFGSWKTVPAVPAPLSVLGKTRERKISPKFFRPKFFPGRPHGMSVPKCLFFSRIWRG